MKPKILIDESNLDLLKQIEIKENERVYGDYICTKREYLVLKKFLEDCQTYGETNLTWRFYDNDQIKFNTSIAVLDSVVSTQECGYKEILFIIELLYEFLGRAANDSEVEFYGDYEKLTEFLKNRLINKQIG